MNLAYQLSRQEDKVMAKAVTFWLDNKQSSGIMLGQIGNQILVDYRDRFYIIVNGAATMRSGRPLRFSKSSLPASWKKLLNGEAAPELESPPPEEHEPATPAVTRKTSVINKKEVSTMPDAKKITAEDPNWPKPPVKKSSQTVKKFAAKPAAQSLVIAECPYCSNKHDIPVEKGRNGKPFFQSCSRCSNDFAIRFVQVTIYQAQVAGFL